MAKSGKIHPQQIKKAQRIISNLPVKDESCSREQAAALLEKDLKRAFKKGYSPKEICALFKKEGIIIARHVIEKYLVEDEGGQQEASPSSDALTDKEEGISLTDSDVAASDSFAQQVDQSEVPQSLIQKNSDEAKIPGQAHSDETCLKPGAFTIMPDTPIGEL